MKMQSEGGKTSMMSQSFNFSPRPSQMTGSRAQQRGFELKSAARSVLNEKDDQAFNHPRFNEIYNYKAMQGKHTFLDFRCRGELPCGFQSNYQRE